MSAKGFQVNWLKERFSYDNEARNPEVEKAMVHHFRNHEKINIIDIGSGTGANCLYFMERLFKNQAWTLIEKDAILCETTIDRIERFLQDYNFYYTFEDNTFRIKVWESRVKITILNASFFDLENLVDLEIIDIVMAAAVFDLLSFEQFEKIILPVFNHKIPLLTTLNYQAMRFASGDTLDAAFVSAYEKHMRREQSTGKAMGPECSTLMGSFFQKNNLKTIKGISQWKLGSDAKKMHKFLFDFMENSIGKEEGFAKWIHEKRKSSQANKLELEVDHIDYFVSF